MPDILATGVSNGIETSKSVLVDSNGITPLDNTITFVSNNSNYQVITVKSGESIYAPFTSPTTSSGFFTNWKDSDGDIVTFPYTTTGDESFTANYVPKSISSDYQEVQYIRFKSASLKQYIIITDFNTSGVTDYEYEIDMILNSAYSYNSIWCSSSDGNCSESWFSGTMSFRQNSGSTGTYSISDLQNRYTHKYKFKNNILTYYFNNIACGSVSGGSTTTYNTYLGVGGAYGNSAPNYTLYSFIIIHGGITTHILIPVYRKSDSKSGLYNIIDNTFFPAEGTVDVGPDVN